VFDAEGSRKETLAFRGMETSMYVDVSPHFTMAGLIRNGTNCVTCE
jgi:hypothetical protein